MIQRLACWYINTATDRDAKFGAHLRAWDAKQVFLISLVAAGDTRYATIESIVPFPSREREDETERPDPV